MVEISLITSDRAGLSFSLCYALYNGRILYLSIVPHSAATVETVYFKQRYA